MKQCLNANSPTLQLHHSQVLRKRSNSIYSITKKTSPRKPSIALSTYPQHNPEEVKTFLRNQKRMAFQSPALEYTDLPGNLKLHFGRPSSPPPKLEIVEYTHQTVPLVPIKIPKRKRGQMSPWVYQRMGWQQQRKIQRKPSIQSISISPSKKLQPIQRYKSVSKVIIRKNSQNQNIYELIKKQMKQKPYQHYNSVEFFKNIRNGDFEEVQSKLSQCYQLAQDFDQQRMTPLHWAAKQGHQPIVKLLCQRFKVDLNAQDNFGKTAIYLASENRRLNCIYRLFIQGAQLRIAANSRKTPKDAAPDQSTKCILQKIQEIKNQLSDKEIRGNDFKMQLEQQIRAKLNFNSVNF